MKTSPVAVPASTEVGAPVAAETLRQVAEEVRAAFPRPIEGHELVLIDVDPRHLHAFWTLPPAAVDAARRGLGEQGATAPMVVRVHEWTDDVPGAAFDVEVVGLQGQCYVDIWDEARRYRATLGLRRPDGTLSSLVASAPVDLPALAPATDGRPEAARAAAEPAPIPAAEPAAAMSTAAPTPVPSPAATAQEPVRHPFPLPPTEAGVYDPDLQTAATAPAPAGGAAAAAEAVADAAPTAAPEPSRAAPASTAGASPATPPPAVAGPLPEPVRYDFPLPPTEAGAYVPELLTAAAGAPTPAPASLPGAAAADTPAAAFAGPATPSPAETGGPGAEAAPPPAPPPLRAEDLPEPVRYDFPLPPTEAGEYVPELIGGFLPPETPSPEPPAEEPAPGPAGEGAQAQPEGHAQPEHAAGPEGEGPLPLPLENVLSLSSFALGREQVEFEINAELHIFGRARPGTQLQLFGRKVTLRPDGSFSITRPLPNGALVLSSLLVNGSGDGHSD